jgi:hypothetical protein
MSTCLIGMDCAACLHVLQALSGALESYTRVLGTCAPNCTGRAVRFFFMLEARGLEEIMGYVAVLEPISIRR